MDTQTMILLGIIIALLFLLWSRPSEKFEKTAVAAAPPASVQPERVPVLALFHADWCGACKAFAPEWSKLTAILDQHKFPYRSIESKDPEMKNHQIKGFPTLRLFPRGLEDRTNYLDFQGAPRTAENLWNFIQNETKMS